MPRTILTAGARFPDPLYMIDIMSFCVLVFFHFSPRISSNFPAPFHPNW